MTTNADRAEILARALHAGVVGDRTTIEAVYTDDVKAWSPAFSVTSLSELLGEFDLRDDAFSDFDLEVIPLDVGGDYACAEWRVSMTHSAELILDEREVIAPTGIRVTLHGVTVAEFRERRICSFRQYWDELSVFDQLGVPQDEG